MNTAKIETPGTQPSALQALARLLEHLERQPGPVGANQYRWIVERLGQELHRARPGPALNALLAAHPATAELYENLYYAQAGLCRHPLDAALSAEQRTTRLLQRLRTVPPVRDANG